MIPQFLQKLADLINNEFPDTAYAFFDDNEGEFKLQIGPKTIWFDQEGDLLGVGNKPNE